MSDAQTWEVDCYVCGHKLGSNKATCGKAEGGKKAVKFPPCVWAHTDDKYVRRAFAEARLKAEHKKALEDTYRRYVAGGVDFSEGTGREEDTEACVTGDMNFVDQQLQEHENARDAHESRHAAAGEPAPESGKGQAEAKDAAESGKGNGGKREANDKHRKTEKHTKWTSTTRTMLYKCIQNKDPFHSGHKDKQPAWETISSAMQEATKDLGDTEEGDLRCYASGKTLQVFYGRMKRNYKEGDEDDKHSGGAGRQDDDTPHCKLKKEEREQLFACIELEKTADEAVQLKRDATKCYDYLKNGIVNDFVVECAAKDPKVHPKLVQELSSRLRQAKMRKMAFEESTKGGTYTYTAQDMENFRLWDNVRTTATELPAAEDIDSQIPASKKGGQLVAALQNLTAQGQQLRQHFTPMSPQDFASEFFKAKRKHAEETKLTLKQKLEMVDKDLADNSISAEEATTFKKKIKDDHYAFAFGSP